jgi:hypothetical protein
LTGRTDTFKRVVFEDTPMPASYRGHPGSSSAGSPLVRAQPGDYVAVEVTEAGGTLRTRPLARTTLREFVAVHGSAAPLGPASAAGKGGGAARAASVGG